MKCNTRSLTFFLAALCLLLICSCSNKEAQTEVPEPTTGELVAQAAGSQAAQPQQLPVRYRNPGFITADDQVNANLGDDPEEFEIKVGANISSTRGPQPLWDILKRLGNLKGMSVSWSSDVDQDVLVDVNINADDNFYEAVDNLLRQVDYFHEVKDNTIIVKYKKTQRFYVSIPYMKGTYTTSVGGNYLTDREAASGTEGTVKITSDNNDFDVWENIASNLDILLQQWRTTAETMAAPVMDTQGETTPVTTTVVHATRQRAAGDAYYTIDRSVGLVTVTAPQPLLEKVGAYLDSLKKELYRQVIIEAKIIEVFLQDNSRIGLDWSQVLKNFNINGLVEFGTGGILGQVYPTPFLDPHGTAADPLTSAFVSTVSLQSAPFSVMLNALNEQGDATVLSNPKITVLNGQPAMISVGTDIAYIKSVSKTDTGSGTSTTSTFSTEVDNVVEGIALGVLASIVDDDSVILHLTPITTNLVDKEIEYRTFGDGLEVGLPKVNVREMSTMVQVNNGEMLIIGGLIDSVEGKQGEFAPVVGDIPFIKYLFGVEEKRKEKRELVILLTPRVI